MKHNLEINKHQTTTNMRVKLIVQYESSDHDGYCSGGECEYESQILTFFATVPEIYKHLQVDDKLPELDKYVWFNFIESQLPLLNGGGSDYCDLSNECIDHDLGRHEYKWELVDGLIIA